MNGYIIDTKRIFKLQVEGLESYTYRYILAYRVLKREHSVQRSSFIMVDKKQGERTGTSSQRPVVSAKEPLPVEEKMPMMPKTT